jgi:large subunit ribosomal protein L24
MPKLKLKKGDEVKVLTGKSKNLVGKILRVLPEEDKVVVEGANMIKKHMKPSANNPEGGIVDREAPIHISNVALVVENKGDNVVTSKIGRKLVDGKLKRFAKKTDNILE